MQPNNDRRVNQPNGNQNHSNLTPAANRNPRTQISPNIPQSTNQQSHLLTKIHKQNAWNYLQQFQILGQVPPQQAQQQFHHIQQAPQQQQQFQHLLSQNQQTRASQIPQNQQQQFQVLPNNQQPPNYQQFQQLPPSQLQQPQTLGLQQQLNNVQNVQNNQGPQLPGQAQQQALFQQQQQLPGNFYPGSHPGMPYLPGGSGHYMPAHNLSSIVFVFL